MLPRVLKSLLLTGVSTALIVAAVAPIPLRGVPATELFFSEYIEGTSNNKALEIYNGTSGPIDLAAGGYNVQMFFNGSPSAGLTVSLTGTVAAGDVFVLAQASANATILAQADQTNGAGWFNGDDAVVLRRGTTMIDVVGQIGTDPGTEWGTGLTSTADNTIRRNPSACAGDANGGDLFDPTVDWAGFAVDTVDGLGSHTASCSAVDSAPQLTSTFPVNGATDVPVNANLVLTFSEPVTVADPWFTLVCSVRGTVAASVTGGPTSFTLDPLVDLTHGETCTLTVVAANVTDQDNNDPPDQMTVDFIVGFTPFDVCATPYTAAYSIQGQGGGAAITGGVTTLGVVTGDFEGASGLQGFYLQDPTGDGDASTSDGLFVFTGAANTVAVGELVRVTGYARERFGQTTLNGSNSNGAAVPPTSIVHCGAGSVEPVDVLMPFTTTDFPERYEGMLVRLPQPLVIAEYFDYERFGELVLALPLTGETRPFTPTAIEAPGAAAVARAAANVLRRITLDDGLGVQNPTVLRHPNGSPFAIGNQFRGGDVVSNTVGVLGFDFGAYRIQPTAPADYVFANPRPPAPEPVDGTLKVAGMNTLNYFVTLDYPTGNPLDNSCGPSQNVECRGADADQPLEFTRQRTKLLAALAGLGADIIGLNELENTSGVDPLGDPSRGIVPGLNDALGAGTYAAIDTGIIGTDAIRVGLIYKPARVAPIGSYQTLDTADDPRFLDTKNRPSLAQTFEDRSSGARFTVVVNHLKSKGSDCNDVSDPDTGDGQGNCNLTRRAAARALVDWLATDPAGSGDADVLVIGDLNAYAKEDPLTAIRVGADDVAGTVDDHTNLIERYQGQYAYSYVFDGQAGALDHALASASLTTQVGGATDWHINADEPDVFDYDTTFKPASQEALYEPNGFRSSDHDAVIVGLDPIRYNFSGFFGLLHDVPAFNRKNAGSSVPLNFSVLGFQGLDVLLAGYPRSRPVSCVTGAPLGGSLPIASPGGSGLSYEASTDRYTIVWKTEKAWSGTCRQVTVLLKDGSVHYANVELR